MPSEEAIELRLIRTSVMSTITIKDANFTITDDADTTKGLKFQVSGVSTGTTRTMNIPDKSITPMDIAGDIMTGRFGLPYVSIVFANSPYTINNNTGAVILCNTAGGNIVVTLPDYTLYPGRIIVVMKTSADVNTVSVDLYSLTLENEYVIFYADASSGWRRIGYTPPANMVVTWGRPSRLFASDGTTKKALVHGVSTLHVTRQASAANGDRLQTFFYARGTETLLDITTMTATNAGKWDLYVNGVLDTSAYDEYSGSSAYLSRSITLTQPIVAGYNLIEIRVNGQNGSSSGYNINVAGLSIQ